MKQTLMNAAARRLAWTAIIAAVWVAGPRALAASSQDSSLETLLEEEGRPKASKRQAGDSNLVFHAPMNGAAAAWRNNGAEIASSLTGGGEFVPGPTGKALALNQSVSYEGGAFLPSGTGALAFWLRLDRIAAQRLDLLLTYSKMQNNYRCDGVGVTLEDGNLSFWTTGGAGMMGGAKWENVEWPAGEWKHIAATWSRKELTLFVNGRIVAQSTPGHMPGFSGVPLEKCLPTTSARRLILDGGSEVGCAIADLRVYSRPLTLEEIGALAKPAAAGAIGGGAEVKAGRTLDDRRELFFDVSMAETLQGARLRMHCPRIAETALTFDQPWEGRFSRALHVVRHGDRFRCYYLGAPTPRGTAMVCCAESPDGIAWTKPNLGLVAWAGARNNNIVSDDQGRAFDNLSVFVDERPGTAPDEQLKAIVCRPASITAPDESAALQVFRSADGVRFQAVGATGALPAAKQGIKVGGICNSIFWSAAEQTYIGFFQAWDIKHTVVRATSANLSKWSAAELMAFGGGEILTIVSANVVPYPRAPHLYLGLAGRLLYGHKMLSEAEAKSLGLLAQTPPFLHHDMSDTILLLARAGVKRFERPFPEALVAPESPADRVAYANIAAQGLAQTGPNEMSFYVTRAYGQAGARIQRLAVRLDGFSSVYAPPAGGELTTKPLRFSGKELEINYAAGKAGGLRVEIQDAQGQPVPGFALADCPELAGDELARIVTWKNGGDLSPLAGKPVRLRFALKDADLFSFQFRPPPSANSPR